MSEVATAAQVGSVAAPASASHTPGMLPGLTPLRGIAALWVVIYHYAFWYFPSLHPERLTHFVGEGYLAVDLFFALSGFVLAHVYQARFYDGLSWRGYFNFLQARVARLYPLHVTVLAAFLIVALVANAVAVGPMHAVAALPLEGARSVTAFVANLFMLQGLRASVLSWNYPAWSVSTEFTAYLALPTFLFLIWRGSDAVRTALALAALGGLIALTFLSDDHFDQWNGPMTLLRCFPEFVGGILLYRTFRRPGVSRLFQSDAVFVAIAAAILTCLHFGGPDVLVTMLFFPLLLACVSNDGVAARLLGSAPLERLGTLSYAIYLVHDCVQYATTRTLELLGRGDRSELTGMQSLLLCIAMIGLSLTIAALAHRLVEVPGRRLLKRPFPPPNAVARR